MLGLAVTQQGVRADYVGGGVGWSVQCTTCGELWVVVEDVCIVSVFLSWLCLMYIPTSSIRCSVSREPELISIINIFAPLIFLSSSKCGTQKRKHRGHKIDIGRLAVSLHPVILATRHIPTHSPPIPPSRKKISTYNNYNPISPTNATPTTNSFLATKALAKANKISYDILRMYPAGLCTDRFLCHKVYIYSGYVSDCWIV